MQKQKILFVTPSFQSFVKNDIIILSEEYQVIVNRYNSQNTYYQDHKTLFQGLKHFFPKKETEYTIISNGDPKFIVMKRNPALLEEIVMSALGNGNKHILQKKARGLITSHFTLKMRKQKSLSLLQADHSTS